MKRSSSRGTCAAQRPGCHPQLAAHAEQRQGQRCEAGRSHPAVLDKVLEVDGGRLAYLHRHLCGQQLQCSMGVSGWLCSSGRQSQTSRRRLGGAGPHLQHQHRVARALGLLAQEALRLLELCLRASGGPLPLLLRSCAASRAAGRTGLGDRLWAKASVRGLIAAGSIRGCCQPGRRARATPGQALGPQSER